MLEQKFYPMVDELMDCLSRTNVQNPQEHASNLLYELTINGQLTKPIFNKFLAMISVNSQKELIDNVIQKMQAEYK